LRGFPVSDRKIINALQPELSRSREQLLGAIFIGVNAADSRAVLTMTQPPRRFAVEALVNFIDARPCWLVIGESAQAQSAGEQTHSFAHRVDVNLVRRQFIIAPQ